MSGPAKTIGVLGAGTMGAGIAQLACRAGARTLLHDPIPEALERGAQRIRDGLARDAEKGRVDDGDAAAALLEPAASIDALAGCELVIEAAPESLTLKHELFGAVAGVVADDCVLASNTSSLMVSAIAAPVPHPERIVGMHFFNPAPVMRLLEVVAGEASNERSLALARATGEAMGKHVIDAADVAGFVVNRSNRPFGLEALRLLQERVATIEQIDRIARMGGGFRMGPFELMDLVGVDVGFEVSKSFFEQSFGEPRWRPSAITTRMVAAGYHGRKSGRGYYDYSVEPYRPEDPELPAPGGGDGRLLVVAGESTIASELREAGTAAGFDVRDGSEPDGSEPWLLVDCGIDYEDELFEEVEADDLPPRAVLCAEGSLAALDPFGTAAGFHLLPPLAESGLAEVTSGPSTDADALARTRELFGALGKHVEEVADSPGLCLGRIVCQVINECSFSLGEGVGSAGDIDAGMRFGVNYPRGPLEWADQIGADHVLAVLDGLRTETGEERYRSAPALRRAAWSSTPLRGA
jgi:3-hydroxybutyryl-CoA dehydrogenase